MAIQIQIKRSGINGNYYNYAQNSYNYPAYELIGDDFAYVWHRYT